MKFSWSKPKFSKCQAVSIARYLSMNRQERKEYGVNDKSRNILNITVSISNLTSPMQHSC